MPQLMLHHLFNSRSPGLRRETRYFPASRAQHFARNDGQNKYLFPAVTRTAQERLMLAVSHHHKRAPWLDPDHSAESEPGASAREKLNEILEDWGTRFGPTKDPNWKPIPVVLIHDVYHDIDDINAITVALLLHKLGFFRILGIVANLEPAWKRAREFRDVLAMLGPEFGDIPVVAGSTGQDPFQPKDFANPEKGLPGLYKPNYFEFLPTPGVPRTKQPETKYSKLERGDTDWKGLAGQAFLKDIFEQAKLRDKQDRIRLVCCSSLMDVGYFVKGNEELFVAGIHSVYMMGGMTGMDNSGHLPLNVTKEKQTLHPDIFAANFRFDYAHSKTFLKVLEKHNIQTRTFTKVTALECPFNPSLFKQMAETGNPLGVHTLYRFDKQVRIWYEAARDPQKRKHTSHTPEWFLGRTTWYTSQEFTHLPKALREELEKPGSGRYPGFYPSLNQEGECRPWTDPNTGQTHEIYLPFYLNYVSGMLYDIFALLGALAEADPGKLGIFKPAADHGRVHQVWGHEDRCEKEELVMNEKGEMVRKMKTVVKNRSDLVDVEIANDHVRTLLLGSMYILKPCSGTA
ncbi:hypothetical protein T439DRAFT_108101 [Meredithblackwellia eburnea MCA 4105]